MERFLDTVDYIKRQADTLSQELKKQSDSVIITEPLLQYSALEELIEGYTNITQGKILQELAVHCPHYQLYYTINIQDLVWDKQFSSSYKPFTKSCIEHLTHLQSYLPADALNIILCVLDKDFIPPHTTELINILKKANINKINYHISSDPLELNGECLLTSYEPIKMGVSNTIHRCYWNDILGLQATNQEFQTISKVVWNYDSQKQDLNLSLIEQIMSSKAKDQLSKKFLQLAKNIYRTKKKLFIAGHVDEEELEVWKQISEE